MTEDEARDWLEREHGVSRETMALLDRFAALVQHESEHQNLVSKQSLSTLWSRHIADSAQLLRWGSGARWLDLGPGPGFPGLVLAALSDIRVTLVEQRRLRADFLLKAARLLAVEDRCDIVCDRIERVAPRPFDCITARAFAPLPELLRLAAPFSTEETRWILPKGRKAQTELEAVLPSWQGDFRLEPSVTDPDARIIVADRVRRRGKETRRT